MAVIIRHLYRIAILTLVLTFAIANVQAKDGELKNVLHVRFDTLTIQPGDRDVFLKVYYTFTAPKPHDFHGYNAHFTYDSTKVRIVEFFLQGTASEQVGYHITNTKPPEAAVVVLGDEGQELDFKNPVFFMMRLSVPPGMTDTARFHWTKMDIPGYFGVDSDATILEDGWIRVQRQRKDVTLSTSPTTAQADSAFQVPVMITDLTDVNVRQARLQFRIDTSILSFEGASQVDTSGAIITSVDRQGSLVTIDLSTGPGVTTLPGKSPIVRLNLKAGARTDTVCTALQDVSFVALNGDVLLGKATILFDSVCIYGSKPDDPAGVRDNRDPELRLAVFPNPFRQSVSFDVNGEEIVGFRVYDDIGREVYASARSMQEWIPTSAEEQGSYHVLVSLKSGRTLHTDIVYLR